MGPILVGIWIDMQLACHVKQRHACTITKLALSSKQNFASENRALQATATLSDPVIFFVNILSFHKLLSSSMTSPVNWAAK